MVVVLVFVVVLAVVVFVISRLHDRQFEGQLMHLSVVVSSTYP